MKLNLRGGRASRGLTLVEILIASVIFVVVAGMIITAILSGWRAHVRTDTKRQALKFARTLAESLTDDIKAGVRLPTNGSIEPGMESAVLWPDPWQGGGVAFGAAGQYRGVASGLPASWTVAGINPDPFPETPGIPGADDVSYNKLVVCRGGSNPVAGRLPQISDFRYVEYDVADNQPNRVYRYVYSLPNVPGVAGSLSRRSDDQSGQRLTNIAPAGGGTAVPQWVIRPAYFTGLNSGNLVGRQGVAAQADHMVVELPRVEDRVEFVISHATYVHPRTGMQQELFHEPNMFGVQVRVFMGTVDPTSGPNAGNNDYASMQGWTAMEEIATQVKVLSTGG